jgi:hypothetical protein
MYLLKFIIPNSVGTADFFDFWISLISEKEMLIFEGFPAGVPYPDYFYL